MMGTYLWVALFFSVWNPIGSGCSSCPGQVFCDRPSNPVINDMDSLSVSRSRKPTPRTVPSAIKVRMFINLSGHGSIHVVTVLSAVETSCYKVDSGFKICIIPNESVPKMWHRSSSFRFSSLVRHI